MTRLKEVLARVNEDVKDIPLAFFTVDNKAVKDVMGKSTEGTPYIPFDDFVDELGKILKTLNDWQKAAAALKGDQQVLVYSSKDGKKIQVAYIPKKGA